MNLVAAAIDNVLNTENEDPAVSEPNDAWYFAYGSNLLRERKEERTRPIREARRCRLRDYRLVFNKRGSGGQIYANIVPEPTDQVWGVIYKCSPAAFEELDDHEGVAGGHYRRAMVTVETDEGEQETAFTYIAGDEHVGPESAPRNDYLQMIVRGARQHDLPQDYIRALDYRAQRRELRPHQRLWRTFPVDRNLHNEWLARLNELSCFNLISICEGHPQGTLRGANSRPHVNLRLKAALVGRVANNWDRLRPQIDGLLVDSLWPEATVEAVLSRRICVGRRNPRNDDDFVVRVDSVRPRDPDVSAPDMVGWFEHCVPAVASLDSGFEQLLGN